MRIIKNASVIKVVFDNDDITTVKMVLNYLFSKGYVRRTDRGR